jgi:hypothetical protein
MLMKRMLPLALILSVLAGSSLAGNFGFDLPVLTWPTDEGAAILGTKGGKP